MKHFPLESSNTNDIVISQSPLTGNPIHDTNNTSTMNVSTLPPSNIKLTSMSKASILNLDCNTHEIQ